MLYFDTKQNLVNIKIIGIYQKRIWKFVYDDKNINAHFLFIRQFNMPFTPIL